MANRNYFPQRDSLVDSDRLVLFCEDRLLVRGRDFLWQPEQVIDRLPLDTGFLRVDHGGREFLAAEITAATAAALTTETRSLRSLLFNENDRDFSLAGKAGQIVSWYRTHRFCGVCGKPTRGHESQRVLYCTACDEQYFPRINPCVIVLVTRGRQVLLARSARFRTGFYSCLAGFIEIGESAEDTVLREVREEAGVEVDNIRYIKSQSWPFPSQLMLGFHADYRAGEIVPEPGEIEEAAFYDIDELPPVPDPGISVAGELIRIYAERFRRAGS